MVKIEIDGIKLDARDGAMLIEAADEAGIPIARFCYHKKLSVAANCRMCLVDVEKAAKPLPACATPITDGMKVHTKSAKAIDAQRGVMEFLLINHPLDCPICDQGGECDLQDLAMGYGSGISRFSEKKRVVKDKNIGPLISTDMTRCIHCTRCVRFGEEIAGIKELGATGRGEHMRIGTYIERAVSSEMSGNVIDLCPVGALTSKPFRYSARAWEMQSTPSIAPHDCVGSNILLQTRQGQVMRVVPSENEAINETWLSDRDRFAYEGLNSADRLQTPRIKKDGQWRDASWEEALEFTVSGLKNLVNRHGAGQLGALSSPSSTLEEMYLLQRIVRGMGSANVDHRLRQCDFSDQDIAPVYPSLGQPIANLDSVDCAVLIGSNIRNDQPILAHRIRKAALSGAKVSFINPVDYGVRFPVAEKIIVSPAGMEQALAGVVKALLEISRSTAPDGLKPLLDGVVISEAQRNIAKHMVDSKNGTLLLGLGAMHYPAFATLRALAGVAAQVSGVKLGYLTMGSNSAGGWLAGALPHRDVGGKSLSYGLNAKGMVESKLKGYVLLGFEPEFDTADSVSAIGAMNNAEFVVCMNSFFSDAMADYADVVLPIAPFSETSGTFVNCEGHWQSFAAGAYPLGQTRPGWKVLRVLGNLLGMGGFDYVSSEDVREEVKAKVGDAPMNNDVQWRSPSALSTGTAHLSRVADVPVYGVDGVVRRAHSLQQTADARNSGAVKIGQSDATRLGLASGSRVVAKQGESEVTLDLTVDANVAEGVALVPAGVATTTGLRHQGVGVELRQA